jgi:hypothetical protein
MRCIKLPAISSRNHADAALQDPGAIKTALSQSSRKGCREAAPFCPLCGKNKKSLSGISEYDMFSAGTRDRLTGKGGKAWHSEDLAGEAWMQ